MNFLLRALLMGSLLLTNAFAAEQLVQRSSCLLKLPRAPNRSLMCFADVIRDTEQRTMELRVYANGFEALGFKHEIAEGDEFINAVGSMFIPSMGRVLFVEWTWGARTVGLTLYRLTPDGTIKEIFHDGGTDGYRLVELGRDREIELVILDKDERSNEYVARSYVVTRSGDFEKPPESSARGLSSLN